MTETVGMRIERADEAVVVYLTGEIDAHAVSQLQPQAAAELTLTPGEKVTVDLGDVGFLDSTGLGFLVGMANDVGGPISLRNVHPPVVRLLKVVGLDEVFTVEPA